MLTISEKGQLHRTNGPAVVVEGVREEWWFMGVRHRTDGPAVILRGVREEWWFMGVQHRGEGLPAVTFVPTGAKSGGKKASATAGRTCLR
jgi:hypothetical protein